MRRILLGCASLLAFAASPALAGDWSGTFAGDYSYFHAGGSDANSVGIDGMLARSLDWNGLSVQANADYHYLWAGGGGGSVNSGTFGGALVWNGMDGRIAANANYHTTGLFNGTTYGVGGEWYGGPDWTLGLRGGGLSVSGGGTGGYVGGEAIKYFDSNWSLGIGMDYTSVGHARVTDYSARVEYLAWQNLSIYGGYTFADIPGTSGHVLTIGLKWYCDGGAPTLVDNNRSAPSAFISNFASTIFQF